MDFVRATVYLASLAFMFSGPIAAQQKRAQLTPKGVAIELTSKLDKDSIGHEEGLIGIVADYLLNGDSESAIAALSALDRDRQVNVLCNAAQAMKSFKGESQIALNLALKLMQAESAESRDDNLSIYCARLSLDLGDLKLTSKFLDVVPNYAESKPRVLVSLAQAYLERGERDAARATLNIAGDHLQTPQKEFLSQVPEVTRLFLKLGDQESANELVKRADLVAISDDDPNKERYQSLRAVALANLGEYDRALSITDSLEGESKSNSLILLAQVYAERGNLEAAFSSLGYARDIAEGIAVSYDRDRVLASLVTAYAKVGSRDHALVILPRINEPFYLVDSAIKLARSYRTTSRSQDAVVPLNVAFRRLQSLVSEKSDDIPAWASGSTAKHKSMALSSLASAYLEVGHNPEAEETAKAIDQPQFKSFVLAEVAAAHQQKGDLAKTKSLLTKAINLSLHSDHYNHDLGRFAALGRIAKVYAEAGFKREAADAVLRFLLELNEDLNDSTIIQGLIDIGRVCEQHAIRISKTAESRLAQILKQGLDEN